MLGKHQEGGETTAGPLEGETGTTAQRRRIPDIISQVKDSFADLRPAERRVAEAVLDDVRRAVEESNADLARRAGVSEPTVTRFCRAIGCDGVRDFKLTLAQSRAVGEIDLDGTEPEIGAAGSVPAFWSPVFGEAHRALREVERQLSPATVLAAAAAAAGARQIACFGLGASASALVMEVQHRLFRYGVSISVTTDPYIMRMSAATLTADDAAIAISASGRTAELVEGLEVARHYGATTIAITAARTPLADAADIALACEISEYPDTLIPTAARFALLASVDLFAAATGYAMGAASRETLRRIKYTALTHRPGQVLEPLGD